MKSHLLTVATGAVSLDPYLGGSVLTLTSAVHLYPVSGVGN